jgi:methylated-DNA-protein-cysteine methyltransferase-like protein
MPYDPAQHGPRRLVGPGFYASVFAVVARVPAGSVATYGDVAQALGSTRIARHVGFALAALPPDSDVPWWRIVAAEGRLARAGSPAARRQAAKLKREGLSVRRGHVVDFEAHRCERIPRRSRR